jgi:hypothetical protein
VGAVAVAVGIALWTERRSGKRITAEHRRSDGLIREERERAAAALADQREHEKSALEDERAHGRRLLKEERRLSLEREQLAQAHAVQVLLAQLPHPNVTDAATGETPATRQLLAGIVNRSAHTVTRIEVRFCLGTSTMASHREIAQLPSPSTPEALRTGPWPCPDPAMRAILTPFDGGLQFETEAIPERDLADPCALALDRPLGHALGAQTRRRPDHPRRRDVGTVTRRSGTRWPASVLRSVALPSADLDPGCRPGLVALLETPDDLPVLPLRDD